MKAVPPVGSAGSRATTLTGPARFAPLAEPPARLLGLGAACVPAGPTAVQVSLARGLLGARLKSRKATVSRSATGSPRPVLGSGLWKSSAQFRSVGGNWA